MDRLRILLLNQFYPPDLAPTGRVAHDLARALVARGHEVRVLCSARSYDGGGGYAARERLDGVEVRRVPASGFGRTGAGPRLIDYSTFMASLLFACFRQPPPELVVNLTTPPYVGLVGSLLSRLLGAAQVHWIMDVYPDVLLAHGLLHEGNSLHRGLCRLARWQLGGADLVVALGPFMEAVVRRHADGARRLESIPLWCDSLAVDPEAVRRLRAHRSWETEFVLMYAGNMGLAHRFDEFLEAARQLGASGPLWVFSGGGARRRELECLARASPVARIRLLDYVPHDLLQAHLASADIHLISLRRAWQGLVVPSKLQAVFGAGRPAIFVGPERNEVAHWILDSGGGWVVPEGDVHGLLRAVEEGRDLRERDRRGGLALAYARQHFGREDLCDRLCQTITEAAAARTSEPR